MNWGKSLVLAMVLFISFIAFIVAKAMRERIDLVAPDYYEQEINYDDQQLKLKNAEKETNAIAFNYLAKENELEFSFANKNTVSGEYTFYYPSDARNDTKINIKLDTGLVQKIDVKSWKTGLWKVKCNYNSGGEKCYKEFSFVR